MPELPEVETICRILKKYIKKKIIKNCHIYFNKIIKYPTVKIFIKQIINQKINNIKRIGKNLLFILDNYILICHLRMTGKWIIGTKNDIINIKHVLIILKLKYKYNLYYCDMRRFGTIHLFLKKEYINNKYLKNIGLDPFNKKITVKYLKNKWKDTNKNIKTILLEQNVISGIGNIYANEILFKSKINPLEKIQNLQNKDFKNIINNTRIILKKAIKLKGTTIFTYQPNINIQGLYTKKLQVYNRFQKKCFICGQLIMKIFINKRGTYYCLNCQKLKINN